MVEKAFKRDGSERWKECNGHFLMNNGLGQSQSMGDCWAKHFQHPKGLVCMEKVVVDKASCL